MAFVIADRVFETTTTTGTGTLDLAGAQTGFETFVAGIGDGNTCFYVIEDGSDFEVGVGTVTSASPDTLARTTVLQSSNGDAAVDWGNGTKNVFCSVPATQHQRLRDILPAAKAETGGSADSYTLTPSPPIGAYVDGMIFAAKIHAGNATTTPTLNVSAVAAKTIVYPGDVAPAAGGLALNSDHLFQYSATLDKLICLTATPSAYVAAGLSAISGLAALSAAPATDDELVINDTDDGGNPKKITVQELFDAANNLAAETAPAAGDFLVLHDVSGTPKTDKITLENFFKAVNGLTEESGIASGDYLVFYDVDGSVARKVDIDDLLALASSGVVAATEQATTSGGSVTFSSLPAGIREIVIGFNGVSTDGTASVLVQLGDSGGVETSGYTSSSGQISGSPASEDFTTGFGMRRTAATDAHTGVMILTRLNDSHLWTAAYAGKQNANITQMAGGTKTLSAELDRVVIDGGGDTFDAGSVNITYKVDG